MRRVEADLPSHGTWWCLIVSRRGVRLFLSAGCEMVSGVSKARQRRVLSLEVSSFQSARTNKINLNSEKGHKPFTIVWLKTKRAGRTMMHDWYCSGLSIWLIYLFSCWSMYTGRPSHDSVTMQKKQTKNELCLSINSPTMKKKDSKVALPQQDSQSAKLSCTQVTRLNKTNSYNFN